MYISKFSISLLAASILNAPLVSSEVLSIGYTDTNNADVAFPISKNFFNPATDISFAISAGLDRRIVVELKNATGVLETYSSEVIGVNDRISSLGKDYYGKVVTFTKPADGSYTLIAKINDINGVEVQADTYPFTIDTVPPNVSTPQASSYGGLDGLDLPADTWYTGYRSTNKYFVNGISDAGSGIDKVNAITREGDTVFKYGEAIYDPQANEAHISHGRTWFPSGDNATRIFGLQFEVIDRAGNKGYSHNQQMYYDSYSGSPELIGVYDPNSTNVLGGQEHYAPYSAGMDVNTNPIKIMYRIPKDNWYETARGGMRPMGQSQIFNAVDDDYAYVVFERPYGFTDGNYIRFTDDREWMIAGISYNLTLSETAPKSPVRLGNHYLYSDIGWSSWSRQVNISDMPLTVSAAKIFVQPRTYDQVFSHLGTCTVPAGESECTVTYSPAKEINRGTYGYLHSGSTLNSEDGSLYGQPGWANVHWNNEKLPSITSTEWDPETKKVTVYANQPQRGYYFDSIRITDAYLENNGTRISVPRTLWEENSENYKFTFDLSNVDQGSYYIRAVVKENHGNYDKATAASFVNDNTAPIVSVFYKDEPIGDLVEGIDGLSISATDLSEMTFLDAQLAGGPSNDTVFLAYSKQADGVFKLEQPRIFPAMTDHEQYTLTVRIKDSYNNIGTATASFKYNPANWLKLTDLKTFPIKYNLKLRDDSPIALVTSSLLRTDSGNLATGEQSGIATLSSEAPFSIYINNDVVSPGQSKNITIDLGASGSMLNIPVYPAESGKTGKAEFMIDLQELTSIYD